MNERPRAPKPKKSVALSGVTAGNTALCSVGRSGNDLHYRGYDILEVAESCDFEEIAYLLIHGKLPNKAQLAAYKTKLRNLRGLPAPVRAVLEQLPAADASDGRHAHRRLRARLRPAREGGRTMPRARARSPTTWSACFGSMLCYWYHFSHNGQRIHVETDDDSVGGHFLHLLHRRPPPGSWVRAMHTSLILYAEHEFNSSTFTARVIAGTGSDIYSCITGAIGALRGPKHGGANEVALEIQERYDTPDEAEADIRRRVANKEIVIGFGHPVYTVARSAQRHHQARGGEAREGGRRPQAVPDRRAHRIADVGHQEDVPEPRLVQRGELSPHGRADVDVHAAVRHVPRHRVERARHRAARGRQDHPPRG